MDIKERIKELPDSPGVYLLKEKKGRVIYIGKASSLRKRVRSHFLKMDSPKEEALQKKVVDIEYIPTSSEAEALLWEAALIKEKQPPYNVDYRDDKSYPFLKINLQERFPPVFIGRGKKEKNLLYFGPYSNVKLLKETLKSIRKVFPFRSCRVLPQKPCLYYSLQLCPAPCIGNIDEEEYKKTIHQICLLLAGKKEELEKELIKRMQEKAKVHNFEEAARLRNQIIGLGQLKALRFGKETVLQELQDILKLNKLPNRIEAFDISHISGKEAVGALVSFYKGIPDKNNYRRFRIKIAFPKDDFSMLREVVFRRFKRLREEKRDLPDLVLVDGGRGHLETVYRELKSLGVIIDIIALEKGEEKIYTLKRKMPLTLSSHSYVLQLLKRIRDEAHRFAIGYYKRLHTKFILESELDRIKGIGEKRKKALIEHFGSLEKIKEASLEEILKLKGMNRRVVNQLVQSLKRYGEREES